MLDSRTHDPTRHVALDRGVQVSLKPASGQVVCNYLIFELFVCLPIFFTHFSIQERVIIWSCMENWTRWCNQTDAFLAAVCQFHGPKPTDPSQPFAILGLVEPLVHVLATILAFTANCSSRLAPTITNVHTWQRFTEPFFSRWHL